MLKTASKVQKNSNNQAFNHIPLIQANECHEFLLQNVTLDGQLRAGSSTLLDIRDSGVHLIKNCTFKNLFVQSQDTPVLIKGLNLLKNCHINLKKITVSNCYAYDALPPVYIYASGQQVTQEYSPTGTALFKLNILQSMAQLQLLMLFLINGKIKTSRNYANYLTRQRSEFDCLQTNIICKKSQYQSRDRQTVVHIPSKAIPDFSETYNTWIYAKQEDQCVFDLTLDDKKQIIAQKFIINQMKFEFTGELQDFVQLNIEGNGFNPCTDNYTLIFRDRSNSEIQFAPIIFDQKTLVTLTHETQQKLTITFPSYLTPQFPHTYQPHSLDNLDTALVQYGNEQDINWLKVYLNYPPIEPIPIPIPDPGGEMDADKGDQTDKEQRSLSTGAIIGFVVAIVVLAIVAVIIELSTVSVRSEHDDQQKSDKRPNTGDNTYYIDEQRQVRVSQGIFVHQSQRGSDLNEKEKKQEQQNKRQIQYDENQLAERSASTTISDNDNVLILSQKKEEEQEIQETQGSQRKPMNDLKRRIGKKDKKINSKTRKGAKSNMKEKQMLQSQEESSNVLLETSRRGQKQSDKKNKNKKEQNENKKKKDSKTVKSIEKNDESSSTTSQYSQDSIKSSSKQSSQSALSSYIQSHEIVAPQTHSHDNKYENEDYISMNDNQNKQSSSQQYAEEEFGRLSEQPVYKDWRSLQKSNKKKQ
ncbi:MAG: hypothetical protein EZS28_012212 [Streblomastix strix]|uniref:Transmembrane protein n=1 Tax=Streblomastix strix TaxID=222440 RepID=A0A5J4WC74_9EUKA|nr:MAG: hypothetical protein EZS28_012212 [Streblomastix strix]